MVKLLKALIQDIRENKVDYNSVLNQFFLIIEESNDENTRIKYIKSLKYIIPQFNPQLNQRTFDLLENLLISDATSSIRRAVISILSTFFQDQALKPITWALKNDSNYNCLVSIFKALASINNDESKQVLINELKLLQKKHFMDDKKQIENKKFKKDIERLFKTGKILSFSHQELAEILINYHTIKVLKQKFYAVFFELENGLVIELDLSDVEYEVRGWKPEFKNNIKNLFEITGLKNLKYLRRLDLSNNQLKSVREILGLKKLTHLYLGNNHLDNQENISYFNNMQSLKYLEIIGNKIADKEFIQEFNPDLEILVKRS